MYIEDMEPSEGTKKFLEMWNLSPKENDMVIDFGISRACDIWWNVFGDGGKIIDDDLDKFMMAQELLDRCVEMSCEMFAEGAGR